jgi:hypothetical protein
MPANPDQPLPLRAVADGLVQHRIPTKSDKNGFHCLLSLLKAGRIQAVVFFPGISADPITVPQSHWMPLGPEALRPLLNVPKKGLAATYKIRLKDVAAEAYRSAIDQIGQIEASRETVAIKLIQDANTKASVEVLQNVWLRFLHERGEDTPNLMDAPTGPGRPKKDWAPVFLELSAILWREIERNNVQIQTQESLAADIAEHLKGSGVPSALKASTIMNNGFAQVRTRMKGLLEKK